MDLFIKNVFFQWSPYISAFESPIKNPPKKANAISMTSTLPPSSETRSEDTWTQLLVTNFLRIVKSKICRSPQVRFLIACSNVKFIVIKFSPPISLRLWIPHSPIPHFQRTFSVFNNSEKIQGDFVHPWGHTRKSWTRPTSLFPWLISQTKNEILDSPYITHPWIKPGTQKMQLQLALTKASCSTPIPPTHQQLKHSPPQKQN